MEGAIKFLNVCPGSGLVPIVRPALVPIFALAAQRIRSLGTHVDFPWPAVRRVCKFYPSAPTWMAREIVPAPRPRPGASVLGIVCIFCSQSGMVSWVPSPRYTLPLPWHCPRYCGGYCRLANALRCRCFPAAHGDSARTRFAAINFLSFPLSGVVPETKFHSLVKSERKLREGLHLRILIITSVCLVAPPAPSARMKEAHTAIG